MKRLFLPEQNPAGKAARRYGILAGAVAAFLSEVIFRPHYSAEFTQFNGFGIFEIPPQLPANVLEWLDLMDNSPLVGLVLLDGADIPHYCLVAVVFLAIFLVLRTNHPVLAGLAVSVTWIGVVVFIISNPAFRILQISSQVQLVSGVERAALIAEADQLLQVYNPLALGSHGWADPARLLILLGGGLMSWAMLSSGLFLRLTAVLGLIANGIGISYYVLFFLLPAHYWLATPISAPIRLVWHILLGVDLVRVSGGTDD